MPDSRSDAGPATAPAAAAPAPRRQKGPGFNYWPYFAREQSGATLALFVLLIQWVLPWRPDHGVMLDAYLFGVGVVLCWYPMAQRNAVAYAAKESNVSNNQQVNKDFFFSILPFGMIVIQGIVSLFGLYLKSQQSFGDPFWGPIFESRMIISAPTAAFYVLLLALCIDDLSSNGALNVQLKGLEGAFKRLERPS